GIGGGGASIVSEIGRSLDRATFVIADTDIRALRKRQGIKYFWFGEELAHGLGTGVNPGLAKEAALKEKEKISEFFKGQDIVVFIASLGGGVGSGATEIFARAAEESGVISFGIFTLPFKFEGDNKAKIARNALKKIRESLNVSVAIPNEKIFKVIDNSTPIVEAFSVVNKNLADSLESLIDLIYNPGVINIDFADVRTILSGRGNFAFLNSAEASGKNRSDDLIKKIAVNPLYQNNNFIAEKILFNIAGDYSLSMSEVEKISSSVSGLNPAAKIIFGVSKNPKLKKKIKATLLMAGPSKTDASPVEKKGIKALKEDKISAEKEKEKKALKESFKQKKPKKAESKAKKQKNKSKKAVGQAQDKEGKENAPFMIPPSGESFPKIPAEAPGIFRPERLDSVLKLEEDGGSEKKLAVKKTIRRNALEIKKAEALEEDKRFLQEKEWEIPAFLRKIKFKP
ncbi:MAG: hypothetical protein HYT36_01665, partial [Candidatus Staskawiczbacteria bacterium]|nr:hypothetical protein [Candidatus Staskawiczbacteria bacterium]